jgi:hypothetical protein
MAMLGSQGFDFNTFPPTGYRHGFLPAVAYLYLHHFLSNTQISSMRMLNRRISKVFLLAGRSHGNFETYVPLNRSFIYCLIHFSSKINLKAKRSWFKVFLDGIFASGMLFGILDIRSNGKLDDVIEISELSQSAELPIFPIGIILVTIGMFF